MVLRIRRSQGTVELVIEGTGAAPVLQQGPNGSGWQASLRTDSPTNLRLGPQSLSLPELGLQAVTFTGSGRDYQLQITPTSGFPLARPVVSADGRNLVIAFSTPPQFSNQTSRLDLRTPGTVPVPTYAPPLQPRAVAPPLGDMAVGSMVLRNQSFVNLSGPPITLTLRNAPARDALLTLAQLGGYGFVYVEDYNKNEFQDKYKPDNIVSIRDGRVDKEGKVIQQGLFFSQQNFDPRPVTLSFRNERFANAVNSVLMAAGWQGKLQGNTLFAGPQVLGKAFGAQVSKVYRLNQASSSSAADYLASLGATITKVSVISNSTTSGQALANQVSGSSQSNTTQTQNVTTTETYGASTGPLRGLGGTTDSRLQTITLVGDPQLIAIAENYLRQLDLRQRQVALSVKILDVSLGNDAVTDNSFAFRYGNNFIVNDGGQLLAAFGKNLPETAAGFAQSQDNTMFTEDTGQLDTIGKALSSAKYNRDVTNTATLDTTLSNSQVETINNTLTQQSGTKVVELPAGSGNFVLAPIPANGGDTLLTDEMINESVNKISEVTQRKITATKNFASSSSLENNSQATGKSRRDATYKYKTRPNPGMNYPKDNFYDFVRAVITSSSTKVLASPTLILSENQEELREGDEVAATASGSGATVSATIGRKRANESFVTVGEQVITNYTIEAGQNGAPNTCQPLFGISGLTFGARVSRIDDNGFVTFTMSPQVAASTRQQNVEGCGPIDILSIRRLDTGSSRVRDGQTLILTGVISDADRQIVSKWPVLGDLPLIGQFFRASAGNREKRELVIMVTPRIIDDNEGGLYGYGYQPGTREARQFLSGQ